ncbi:hypothetical protein Q7S_24866 (plasmid) [Rahnella aquatilis HX2]|nr:hypothetical protein Q7S_24866 [Rahnella aquatilis HX2]
MAKRWVFNGKLVSLAVRGLDLENFGFSLAVRSGPGQFRFLKCCDHLTRCAETDQEGKVLFPSWISLRFFNTRYRSLAMFQVAQRQAGNLAAARCLHFGIAASGLKPLIQQAF